MTALAARVALLAAAGVVGALAYPRVDFWLGAWMFLVPALMSAATRRPREALADGWLSGTVFFLVLLRWLDHTFRNYSAIPWPVSWLPIVALAAYCGLYVGAVTATAAWLRPRLGGGWAMAAVPPLWVAGEWVRGWLMQGFPWGLIGYSQHSVLPVIQIAELTGVYGVSFLVIAGNAALAGGMAFGWRRAWPGAATAAVLVLASLGFGLAVLGQERGPAPPGARIAVIQPVVAQSLKWDPAYHAEILALYERLTREAARSRPAAIIWPETAAAIFLRGDPALLERLTRLAQELGTPLVLGSVDRQPGPRGAFLNSAFYLTGQGISDKYDKIHLVPFGEYVPLAGLIGFVRSWAEFISDFAPGERRTIFPLPGAPFGVVICYEVVFPELFRQFVAGGAAFMANITNDAWFGETSGPWQHLAMVPFRAVENRVAIARAANTGVSAFVAPSGAISAWRPLGDRGTLEATVPLRRRTTVYTRFGDWFAWTCVGGAAVIVGGALFRRSSRQCSES
ncbi:MAG TPA: apolipoprotein N-acyltransferase [Candidatus Limnocylindrales bacterium]|nr:apolipoprotein N-acyltransferase [Candidatus Limnocylindrales bacterium]